MYSKHRLLSIKTKDSNCSLKYTGRKYHSLWKMPCQKVLVPQGLPLKDKKYLEPQDNLRKLVHLFENIVFRY